MTEDRERKTVKDMQDYRKLNIWIEAMAYVEEIYRISLTIAREERYGLVDQLKRAAVSIPLNIAEGAGCHTNRDFERFLSYSYRSVNEVVTCIELAKRLKLAYSDHSELERLIDRGDKMSAMIYKFMRTLKD